jgi:hypothetical protein
MSGMAGMTMRSATLLEWRIAAGELQLCMFEDP